MSDGRLSFSQVCLWLFLSMLCTGTTATVGWLYFQHIKQLRYQDDQYRIIALVQTGPEKEALKTVFLEELLDLSVDKPANLFRFNTQAAERKLLECPLIKKAVVKKIKPGTLYIDYSIRQPIAFLADYSNTAIDAEGVLIPFTPFFTPKKIPEITLGVALPEGEVWGTQMSGRGIKLAFDLLEQVNSLCCSQTSYLRKVDVNKAFADSYGQRQLVVVIEDWFEKEQEGRSVLCIFPRILRLSTANYLQELKDYLVLRDQLQQQELQQVVDSTNDLVRADPMIIDMRIAQIAFLKE
jgi:hypothetical protein